MLKEVLLLALTALCVSDAKSFDRKTADMDFLHKQKKIYELLFFVKQNDLVDTEFYDIGRNYDIENNIDMYKDKPIVQEFLYFYRNGNTLRRDAIYSPYYEEHREETKLLFKLFYAAKDFQIFYKTAAWARYYLNDGVFTSAFTVAVFYRPDCKYMRLPAPYEIYPNLYFDSNVIQKAHYFKMTHGIVFSSNPIVYRGVEGTIVDKKRFDRDANAGLTTTKMDNVESYPIFANYSGNFVKPYFDDEYKLDYFMEDFGLNSYYYYFRQVLPFWLDIKDFDFPTEFRGYFYYFYHQQLLSRYFLERISNDLSDIEEFDWNKPFYPGYYSTLAYSNGIAIPQRPRYTDVPFYKYKYLKEIETLEMRITNAIDLGYVYDKTGKQINIYTPEGFNILASLIEGNVDSCNRRFYGMYDALARDILGFNFDYKNKNKVIPSALQCYDTSLRDPGFYRLYKRIMSYFFRYKKYMPYYTQNELVFPGVKFESVDMDKLQTYFDYCNTFINNAIAVESFKEGMKLRVEARRYCLNHKPFTYRFNVNSDKETKAVLRIFLGPAFDDTLKNKDVSYLREYYKYFIEMDKFVVTLKQGTNVFERRSSDSAYTTPDMTPVDILYQKLDKAISGSEPFTYYEKLFGFPERLILPKGKPEGMRFKMFFYLSPFDETKSTNVELPVFGKFMLDGKPPGFPLDRPMYPWKFFTSNMFFKDVYIYHATENEQKVNF